MNTEVQQRFRRCKENSQMNIITEMKNTLEKINSRLNGTEVQIRKLENKIVPVTDAELKKGLKIMRTV